MHVCRTGPTGVERLHHRKTAQPGGKCFGVGGQRRVEQRSQDFFVEPMRHGGHLERGPHFFPFLIRVPGEEQVHAGEAEPRWVALRLFQDADGLLEIHGQAAGPKSWSSRLWLPRAIS
jgi:hypothetical protein